MATNHITGPLEASRHLTPFTDTFGGGATHPQMQDSAADFQLMTSQIEGLGHDGLVHFMSQIADVVHRGRNYMQTLIDGADRVTPDGQTADVATPNKPPRVSRRRAILGGLTALGIGGGAFVARSPIGYFFFPDARAAQTKQLQRTIDEQQKQINALEAQIEQAETNRGVSTEEAIAKSYRIQSALNLFAPGTLLVRGSVDHGETPTPQQGQDRAVTLALSNYISRPDNAVKTPISIFQGLVQTAVTVRQSQGKQVDVVDMLLAFSLAPTREALDSTDSRIPESAKQAYHGVDGFINMALFMASQAGKNRKHLDTSINLLLQASGEKASTDVDAQAMQFIGRQLLIAGGLLAA